MIILFSIDVFLRLNGTVLPKNGYVRLSDIGSTDETALLCHTNRLPPPYGPLHSGGDWFAPDGTRLQRYLSAEGVGFTRSRGPMVVRLKRSLIETPEEGIYTCIIGDDSSLYTSVYVGIYNTGGGISIINAVYITYYHKNSPLTRYAWLRLYYLNEDVSELNILDIPSIYLF